jgi:hypothetical protein
MEEENLFAICGMSVLKEQSGTLRWLLVSVLMETIFAMRCICIDFQKIIQVWQALLAVRELVLPPNEDRDTWIKFAKLCWKNGRISQARSTLVKLLQVRYHSLLLGMCL